MAVLLLTLLVACGGNSFDRKQGVRLSVTDIEQAVSQPKLQIIVTYNGSMSTHAALRLEHPKRGSLFWDPGGGYGLSTVRDGDGWTELSMRPAHRKNDLFQADAPSLPSYWRFAVLTDETAMVVLEWVLTEQRADQFHQILLSGAQDGGRPDGFTTDSAPLFCAVALSEFLRQYGQGLATADKNYFWPSDLADHLRAQRPSRTLVFSIDEPKATYVSVGRRTPSNRSGNPAIHRQILDRARVVDRDVDRPRD